MKSLLKSKGGAEMTIGTIIIIILALIVLVFLVFGFSTGWSNLWDKITNLGSNNNVETIKQACQVACETNAKYDFQQAKRTLKIDGEKIEGVTCEMLKSGLGKDKCYLGDGVTIVSSADTKQKCDSIKWQVVGGADNCGITSGQLAVLQIAGVSFTSSNCKGIWVSVDVPELVTCNNNFG